MDAGITKSDMTLSDDLTTDCTSGGVVAIGTTWSILLHIKLFSKPLFAELTSESTRTS